MGERELMIIRNGRQFNATQEQIDTFIADVTYAHQVCSFEDRYEGNFVPNGSGVPEAVYVLITVNDVTSVQTIGVREHFILPGDVDDVVNFRVNAIIDNLLYAEYGVPMTTPATTDERIDQLAISGAESMIRLADVELALAEIFGGG
jgi:hypothetical protein